MAPGKPRRDAHFTRGGDNGPPGERDTRRPPSGIATTYLSAEPTDLRKFATRGQEELIRPEQRGRINTPSGSKRRVSQELLSVACPTVMLSGSGLSASARRGQTPAQAASINNKMSNLRMGQFYKTKTCPWFSRGTCERGESCRFAHSEEELRTLPDLSRTSFCPALVKHGVCRDSSCRFAHGVEQLRATDDMYKTSLCFMHMKSRCDAGSQCRHAHGTHELRAPISGAAPIGYPGPPQGAAAAILSARGGKDFILEAGMRERAKIGHSPPHSQPVGSESFTLRRGSEHEHRLRSIARSDSAHSAGGGQSHTPRGIMTRTLPAPAPSSQPHPTPRSEGTLPGENSALEWQKLSGLTPVTSATFDSERGSWSATHTPRKVQMPFSSPLPTSDAAEAYKRSLGGGFAPPPTLYSRPKDTAAPLPLCDVRGDSAGMSNQGPLPSSDLSFSVYPSFSNSLFTGSFGDSRLWKVPHPGCSSALLVPERTRTSLVVPSGLGTYDQHLFGGGLLGLDQAGKTPTNMMYSSPNIDHDSLQSAAIHQTYSQTTPNIVTAPQQLPSLPPRHAVWSSDPLQSSGTEVLPQSAHQQWQEPYLRAQQPLSNSDAQTTSFSSQRLSLRADGGDGNAKAPPSVSLREILRDSAIVAASSTQATTREKRLSPTVLPNGANRSLPQDVRDVLVQQRERESDPTWAGSALDISPNLSASSSGIDHMASLSQGTPQDFASALATARGGDGRLYAATEGFSSPLYPVARSCVSTGSNGGPDEAIQSEALDINCDPAPVRRRFSTTSHLNASKLPPLVTPKGRVSSAILASLNPYDTKALSDRSSSIGYYVDATPHTYSLSISSAPFTKMALMEPAGALPPPVLSVGVGDRNIKGHRSGGAATAEHKEVVEEDQVLIPGEGEDEEEEEEQSSNITHTLIELIEEPGEGILSRHDELRGRSNTQILGRLESAPHRAIKYRRRTVTEGVDCCAGRDTNGEESLEVNHSLALEQVLAVLSRNETASTNKQRELASSFREEDGAARVSAAALGLVDRADTCDNLSGGGAPLDFSQDSLLSSILRETASALPDRSSAPLHSDGEPTTRQSPASKTRQSAAASNNPDTLIRTVPSSTRSTNSFYQRPSADVPTPNLQSQSRDPSLEPQKADICSDSLGAAAKGLVRRTPIPTRVTNEADNPAQHALHMACQKEALVKDATAEQLESPEGAALRIEGPPEMEVPFKRAIGRERLGKSMDKCHEVKADASLPTEESTVDLPFPNTVLSGSTFVSAEGADDQSRCTHIFSGSQRSQELGKVGEESIDQRVVLKFPEGRGLTEEEPRAAAAVLRVMMGDPKPGSERTQKSARVHPSESEFESSGTADGAVGGLWLEGQAAVDRITSPDELMVLKIAARRSTCQGADASPLVMPPHPPPQRVG